MSTLGKSWSGAGVSCPRPEHAGSRVRFDGHYGAEPRVVCNNDLGLTHAIAARFPGAELYLCEWHLRHALERLMHKVRTEQPEYREAIDELLGDLEAGFTGPSFWTPFVERCHAAALPRVSDWLNTTGQNRRRAVRSPRAPLQPAC